MIHSVICRFTRCGHSSNLAAGIGLMALLLTTSPAVLAKPSDTGTDEGWGRWEALDRGMAGRRRVPPKLDQAVEERRSDDTELRHAEARRLAKALRRAEARGKGDQRRQGRDRSQPSAAAQTSAAQTAQKTVNTATLQEAMLLEAALTPTTPVTAAWLRTGPGGLYAVSVADLAAGMGQTQGTIRNRATRGTLSLTTGGQIAPWYFDAVRDQLLFAGVAYETFHTDENAHRIYFGTGKRRLMTVASGTPTQAAGAQTPFRDTLHFEEEPDMFYSTGTVASEPDADYWFWDYLYGGYKDQIQVALTIPNPAPSGTAQLRIRLRGWTDLEAGDEHQVSARLNGTPVGATVTWDGFAEALLVADVAQSLLKADGNNTLTLHNAYAAGTHPGQWLDDVEIDYDRLPVAAGGSLWLHQVPAGVQTVTGLASGDILVVESPTGNAVLRQDVRIDPDGASAWRVTFAVAVPADYLVVERTALAAPAIAPDYPVSPSLTDLTNQADYLIIYAPEFAGTAQALAAYRDLEYGVVKTVNLDDIYDQYSAGREDPTAITRFMDRVKKWSRVPAVVTLIGKGSLDHKNRMGYGDSFLPVVMTDTPWALAASDDRLLGGNSAAPFAIGRLPITNDAEGFGYLQKLSAYEASGPAVERRAVLAADNPDAGGDFHTNSDLLAERLLGRGFTQATKLYHPRDAVRSQLIASATWAVEYVGYDGHGSTAQVGNGSERFITAADAAALRNSALPVFTALTCAAGDDTVPGVRSLAGALVLNPDGGAIAAVAPTGLSLDADAQTLGNALVDRLFDGAAEDSVGTAVREAKAQTSGEISAFMHRIYSVVGEPGVRVR